MVIKRLIELNFDFGSLPEDLKMAFDALSQMTKGSFESKNERVLVLDRTLFDSIAAIMPDNVDVQAVKTQLEAEEKKINNDSFNTTGIDDSTVVASDIDDDCTIGDIKIKIDSTATGSGGEVFNLTALTPSLKAVGKLHAATILPEYVKERIGRNARVVHIQNMNVIPDFRRMGIGSKMIECLKGITLGYDALYLYCDSTEISKDDLVKFYESNGFELLSGTSNPYDMIYWIPDHTDKKKDGGETMVASIGSIPDTIDLSGKRTIFSHINKIQLKEISPEEQAEKNIWDKPVGLWYGFGTEWLDFVKRNEINYKYCCIHEVKVTDKILRLDTEEKIIEFSKRFGVIDQSKDPAFMVQIMWGEVAKHYAGIELIPYAARWDKEYEIDGKIVFLRWLYTWDIASGCVWSSAGVTSIDLVYEADSENAMRNGGDLIPDQVEQKVISASSRFRPVKPVLFHPPLIGKSGAQLTSYEWAWKPEEYIDRRGEDAVRRISDWDRAESSGDTGRDVVHQFTVKMPDGTSKTVSSESVLHLLGYTELDAPKNLPSLVSAVKTLARQQMELASKEAQIKQYEDAKSELRQAQKPEITKGIRKDSNNRPYAIEWRMGSTTVIDHHLQNDVIPQERKDALEDAWIREQLYGRGINPYPPDTYDLKRRIERQQRKIEQILQKSEHHEMKDGGNVKTEVDPRAFVLEKLLNKRESVIYTPEFKNWFGDWQKDPSSASKMVDDNGNPLICFHGTNEEFTAFRPDAGHSHDAGFYGAGYYFTFQRGENMLKYAYGEAGHYGNKIIPAYLNVKNPFNMEVLRDYKGHYIMWMGVNSLVFLYNVAKLFPEISNEIYIGKTVWTSDTEGDVVNVPISVLPDLIDKYASEMKTYTIKRPEGVYIDGYVKSEVVEYDHTAVGGRKGSYLRTDGLSSRGYREGDYPSEVMEIFFIQDALKKYDNISVSYHPEGYMTRYPEITKAIKEKYDGIIQGYSGDEVVVFHPEQIKLADGSNTTFDPNSPNIRKEEGGDLRFGSSHLSGDHKKVYEFACQMLADCQCTPREKADKLLDLYDKEIFPHFQEEEREHFSVRNDEESRELYQQHLEFYQLIDDIRETKSAQDVNKFCELIKDHIRKEEKYFASTQGAA